MTALVTDSGRKTPARLAGSAVLACQSDERLITLVRSGHERAFEAIVARYSRPLLRFCRRILPESRAEDAVQQTFINAHASLMDSDEVLQLKPWLFKIARNASLNMLRQNGWNYEQIPLDFDGVRRPDQVFEGRVEFQQTVDAVNHLPDRQRSAIVMREFEGRSYDEIAVALGANDGAVRQLLNRARGTLRTAASAILPPPLVARLATSAPPDGRRAAELIGGLGAAGIAKVGATALVAGSLVIGAVNIPLPLAGSQDKPVRESATLATHGSGSAKATPAATRAPAHVVPIVTKRAAKRVPAGSVRRTRGAAPTAPSGSGRHSGSSPSGSGRDDHSGSSGGSGSGDDSHSGSGGSGDTSHSGSDDSSGSGDSGKAPTSGSGSDDNSSTTTTESSDSTSGSGSGSDDTVTTAPSSGETTALDTSGHSGSDSSGSGSSGSGSDDPDPSVSPTDGH